MWQNNRRITGLWVINENRNAWVWVDGLGWRKLAPNNDTSFQAMVTMATHAKADNRPVNFREVGVGGNIEIHEMYVW
jgi:hypothetical protein